jgi:hypothetical protein
MPCHWPVREWSLPFSYSDTFEVRRCSGPPRKETLFQHPLIDRNTLPGHTAPVQWFLFDEVSAKNSFLIRRNTWQIYENMHLSFLIRRMETLGSVLSFDVV